MNDSSRTNQHSPDQPAQGANSSGLGLGPGATFGRYLIERLLGEGAMGAVFLAVDSSLGRRVALKIPKFAPGDTEGSARFLREARLAAALQHRNICPVFDVGEVDGRQYLTMAFVEGRTLETFITRDKPLPQRQAAAVVRKLALALADAHAAGIVHRDLKPANIMIDRKGEPIVMDFGLARSAAEGGARITQSGMIVGSPAYMSPEQAGDDPAGVGPRSDIYSLGIVFFELLTGRVPFEGSVMAVLGSLLTKDVPSPKEIRLDLDERLETICRRMTARQVGDRYASVREVAEAIRAALIAITTDAATSDQSTSAADRPGSESSRIPSVESAFPNSGSIVASSQGGSSPRPTADAQTARIGVASPPANSGRFPEATLQWVPGSAVPGPVHNGPTFEISEPAPAPRRAAGGSRSPAAAIVAYLRTAPRRALVGCGVGIGAAILLFAVMMATRSRSSPAVSEEGEGDPRSVSTLSDSREPGTQSVDESSSADGDVSRLDDTQTRSGTERPTPANEPPGATANRAVATDSASERGPEPKGGFDAPTSPTTTLRSETSIQKVRTLEGHKMWVRRLVFTPDGTRLASGSYGVTIQNNKFVAGPDNTVRIWNVATGKEIRRFFLSPGHTSRGVQGLAISPDGEHVAAACSFDYFHRYAHPRLYVWNISTGKRRDFFTHDHAHLFRTVAFSPDGGAVTVGVANRLLFSFSMADGSEREISNLAEKNFPLAFSNDGRTLLCGDKSGRLYVRDVSTSKDSGDFAGFVKSPSTAAVAQDGSRIVACSSDFSVRSWDVASGKPLFSQVGLDAVPLHLCYAPDGRHFAAAWKDGFISLHDAATARETNRWEAHSGPANWIAFSPRENLIATGGNDSAIHLWLVEWRNDDRKSP